MYLPQFHRVKENDEWWGDGFTEWTAVKNAKPLFEGHLQPRVPIDSDYYDLLKKETMMRQAGLMHQYGIDGFVFYHYYFKDGRKILERPAENLLKWKEIDMPFCFSWANETWARSWSNISDKNVWSDDGNSFVETDYSDGVLLKQAYGQEGDWVEHFYYLRPFFEDERYIKVENKPLFIIYRTESIGCLVDMLEVWRRESKKCGMDGLYVISTNKHSDACDGELFQEPQHSTMLYYQEKYNKNSDGIERKIEYDEISWKSICFQSGLTSPHQYSGVFPSYDDTPRRGKAGTAIVNSTPQKFRDYIETVMKISLDRGSNMVFINAWNEWGETMYLEPDELYGYQYLEAMREVKNSITGYTPKCVESGSESKGIAQEYERKLEQYRSYWTVLDRWLTLKEANLSLMTVFDQNHWEKIAVYGVGMIGTHLIKEINSCGKQLQYGIDGKGSRLKMSFPVYTMDEDLPKVDVIIVTVCHEYKTIKERLEKKVGYLVVSLADIIDKATEKLEN